MTKEPQKLCRWQHRKPHSGGLPHPAARRPGRATSRMPGAPPLQQRQRQLEGLGPKYLASKQARTRALPVASQPARPNLLPPQAAPIPAAPQGDRSCHRGERAARPRPSPWRRTGAAKAAPPARRQPLPATGGQAPPPRWRWRWKMPTPSSAGSPEMNHRLKLRLQSLTEEVGDPQGPVAGSRPRCKGGGGAQRPSRCPRGSTRARQSWLMELLSSPLNLAMPQSSCCRCCWCWPW